MIFLAGPRLRRRGNGRACPCLLSKKGAAFAVDTPCLPGSTKPTFYNDHCYHQHHHINNTAFVSPCSLVFFFPRSSMPIDQRAPAANLIQRIWNQIGAQDQRRRRPGGSCTRQRDRRSRKRKEHRWFAPQQQCGPLDGPTSPAPPCPFAISKRANQRLCVDKLIFVDTCAGQNAKPPLSVESLLYFLLFGLRSACHSSFFVAI